MWIVPGCHSSKIKTDTERERERERETERQRISKNREYTSDLSARFSADFGIKINAKLTQNCQTVTLTPFFSSLIYNFSGEEKGWETGKKHW